VRTATEALDGYDHARALETTEKFFWTFCDDYLELVKERAYGATTPAEQASAVLTLRLTLEGLLRLLAPYLPFATEEVWSWTHDDSVHRASWPSVDELGEVGEPTGLLGLVGAALIGVRRAKSEAKAPQKTPVTTATIAAPAAQLEVLRRAEGDLAAVGRIRSLTFVEGEELAVTGIELAELPEQAGA